jgi:hypothetical protein
VCHSNVAANAIPPANLTFDWGQCVRSRMSCANAQPGVNGELCLRGAELTRDEIDLLCRTDARLWFLGAKWKAHGTDTPLPSRRSAV